ncbi:ATP-grasp domain-containing protein [Bacillus sp. SM2101]|uniref:ATP-grasp domain-containing protein n=1 Tax=Bacillus sp. SM2101 TaxID=2805366 RepID=UPI001BDEF370|nr:ATP-grasp domain-containing protein [Bacillus sp. SM2101]
MAILLINRFSNEKIPFSELLKDSQEELILLTANEQIDTYDKGYAYVEGFNNFDNNAQVEFRAIELSKSYNFSSIVVTSEYDINRTARLREKLGVQGQGIRSASAFRDKIIMKEYAQAVVEVPNFRRIKTPFDIYDFLSDYGFPIVIKPIDGSGSINTYILKDQNELNIFLENGKFQGFEIEEYIQGDMYTVDGLYQDGEVLFSWPGRYVNDCLSFHDGKQASNVQLAESNPLYNRLQQFIQELITSMPMPKVTPFHAEVFHTSDNRLVLCEIASRTGGGCMNELAQFKFGVNLNHAWVQGQCGLVSELNLVRNDKIFGFVQIPPRKGKLLSIPKEVPFHWVVNYQIRAEIGMINDSINNSADKIAVSVVEGKTEEEVVARMDLITKWVEDNCIWETNWQYI